MSENFWIAFGLQTVVLLSAGLRAYIGVITRLTRLEAKVEFQRCREKDDG